MYGSISSEENIMSLDIRGNFLLLKVARGHGEVINR